MRVNDVQLTKNFRLYEFEDPTTKTVMIFMPLITILQQLRDEINEPIEVTSGYRTPKHNLEVGGLPNSFHPLGHASDVRTRYSLMQRLYEITKKYPEIQSVRERDIIHIEYPF